MKFQQLFSFSLILGLLFLGSVAIASAENLSPQFLITHQLGKLTEKEWLNQLWLASLAKKGYKRTLRSSQELQDLNYAITEIPETPFTVFYPSVDTGTTYARMSFNPLFLSAFRIESKQRKNLDSKYGISLLSYALNGKTFEQKLDEIKQNYDKTHPRSPKLTFSELYLLFDQKGNISTESVFNLSDETIWQLFDQKNYQVNSWILMTHFAKNTKNTTKRYLNFGKYMQKALHEGKAKVVWANWDYYLWVDQMPDRYYVFKASWINNEGQYSNFLWTLDLQEDKKNTKTEINSQELWKLTEKEWQGQLWLDKFAKKGYKRNTKYLRKLDQFYYTLSDIPHMPFKIFYPSVNTGTTLIQQEFSKSFKAWFVLRNQLSSYLEKVTVQAYDLKGKSFEQKLAEIKTEYDETHLNDEKRDFEDHYLLFDQKGNISIQSVFEFFSPEMYQLNKWTLVKTFTKEQKQIFKRYLGFGKQMQKALNEWKAKVRWGNGSYYIWLVSHPDEYFVFSILDEGGQYENMIWNLDLKD